MWVKATRAVESQKGQVEYVQTNLIERVWKHETNTVVRFNSSAQVAYLEPVEHFLRGK